MDSLQRLQEEVDIIKNEVLRCFQSIKDKKVEQAQEEGKTALNIARRLKPTIKHIDFSADEDITADKVLDMLVKVIAVLQLLLGILEKIKEQRRKYGDNKIFRQKAASSFQSAYNDIAMMARSLTTLGALLRNASCPAKQVQAELDEVLDKEREREGKIYRRGIFKVLIVEDQYWPLELLKKAIRTLLGKTFFTPKPFFRGKENINIAQSYAGARELIKKNKYDLVLLDHRIPRTDPGFRDIDDRTRFSVLLTQAAKAGVGGYNLIPLIRKKSPLAVIIGTSSLKQEEEETAKFSRPDYTIDKNEADAGLAAIFQTIYRTAAYPPNPNREKDREKFIYT